MNTSNQWEVFEYSIDESRELLSECIDFYFDPNHWMPDDITSMIMKTCSILIQKIKNSWVNKDLLQSDRELESITEMLNKDFYDESNDLDQSILLWILSWIFEWLYVSWYNWLEVVWRDLEILINNLLVKISEFPNEKIKSKVESVLS